MLCYHQSGGIFYLLNFTLLFAFCIYSGGCLFAAREATKFMERFKEKVPDPPMPRLHLPAPPRILTSCAVAPTCTRSG